MHAGIVTLPSRELSPTSDGAEPFSTQFTSRLKN
jgi:hypothetical protein